MRNALRRSLTVLLFCSERRDQGCLSLVAGARTIDCSGPWELPVDPAHRLVGHGVHFRSEVVPDEQKSTLKMIVDGMEVVLEPFTDYSLEVCVLGCSCWGVIKLRDRDGSGMWEIYSGHGAYFVMLSYIMCRVSESSSLGMTSFSLQSQNVSAWAFSTGVTAEFIIAYR